MKKYFLLLIVLPLVSFSQSDFEKTIQAGSVLVNGLSFLKGNKSSDNKTVLMLCIKNKLSDKITFKITGKDKEDNDVKKDMVIQNNGKECLFEIPKGVYTYEVILANKDTFKKGEYKFDEDITITIKKDE
ncbi:hypothetical protein [Flavobacterium phycosphaerae]|uniref:hypothetical protein n=1 Tax=Flavobacterium phycosphaerae TaxID=2697515 RepID=UPI00138A6629|nr:hypothetical protein [Flavobacterium phycosphaerae]